MIIRLLNYLKDNKFIEKDISFLLDIAIEEAEELNNRCCDNCLHYNPDMGSLVEGGNGNSYLECDKFSIESSSEFTYSEEFYCSYWKRKSKKDI